MFAIVKKSRTVAAALNGQIPPSKILANTPRWRERVREELDRRPRGEHARVVEYVQRWYPRFSAGTFTGLLADDKHPGELRASKYIELINRFLWPDENEIDEGLEMVIRKMPVDEQRSLADFLAKTHKPK